MGGRLRNERHQDRNVLPGHDHLSLSRPGPPDPTFTRPLAFLNWEQVAGKGDSGSLVYMFELKNPNALENPLVTPYYRDDACLDDGTGDDPSRPAWPGGSYAG